MSRRLIPPTQEQLESITYTELTAYLTHKNIAIKCKECGSRVISINVCSADGTELSITEDRVISNKNSSTAYQYFSIVCGNCGHTRFFNAIVIYRGVIEGRNAIND
jgi:DNA-directed RNA polymerase subunit RPC12/RpoP